MQPLSGLDSSFLYLETPSTPMHIGGLSVVEGSLDFDSFRRLLASRIHLARTFRQRLVQVPLSLDHPYWVDDPDFVLDRHLHHTALPQPGGWQQLRKLASRIFGQPLDRSRPLWEMVFVEGLDSIPQVPPGSVAIISKVHHAAIDGASGADILSLLYDTTLQPRQVPPPKQRLLKPMPNDLELMARSAYHFAKRPFNLPRLLLETARSTLNAGRLSRVQGAALPTVPFSAPRTPLNVPVVAQRVWNTALLSLNRVKALRHAVPEATINDVVLTICAGALRRYLLEKRELPDKPLVAMVPVSTRAQDEKNRMGNQVSAMLIQLATDIADPIERLAKIRDNTIQGKAYQGAVSARSLMEYAEFVPFGVAGQAARLYTRAQIAKYHNPFFNVVITNVPGPQIPLYLHGHRLLAHMGMAPIFDGVGLILPVFSYNGILSISATSAPNVMPDIDLFVRYLREAANELEALVLAQPAPAATASVSPTAAPVANGRCQATTQSGQPCRVRPQDGKQFCHIHRAREGLYD